MRTFLLPLVAILAGCGPTELEKSYESRIVEAKAHCVSFGGDEFKPYGAAAWISMVKLQRPASFRCIQLRANIKWGVAVYIMRVEGQEVKMTIRTGLRNRNP